MIRATLQLQGSPYCLFFMNVLLLGFAECGNRKALRLRAQGVYLCK